MRFTRVLALLATLTASSFAGVVYDFSYAATSGPVDNFSFSITSNSLIGTNPSVEFNPFTITAGGESFTISKLDVYHLPWASCFTFGTANSGAGMCGGSAGDPGNAMIAAGFYPAISGYGTYTSNDTIIDAAKADNTLVEGKGVMTVTVSEGGDLSTSAVSDVPEPASMATFAVGIVCILSSRYFRRRTNR